MDKRAIKTFSEFCEEQTCDSCPFYNLEMQCDELYKPRKVKIPAIYKHFKHKEDGIINNYLHCTMFLAYHK